MLQKLGLNNNLLTLIAIALILVGAINANKNMDYITSEAKEVLYLSRYKQVEVTIEEGVHPWDLQQELAPNEDINKLIDLVIYINQLDQLDFKVGDKIILLQAR